MPWRCLTSKEFIRPNRSQASAGAPREAEVSALRWRRRRVRVGRRRRESSTNRPDGGRRLRDAADVAPKTGSAKDTRMTHPRTGKVLAFALAKANGSRCWRRTLDAAPPASKSPAGSDRQSFAPGTREGRANALSEEGGARRTCDELPEEGGARLTRDDVPEEGQSAERAHCVPKDTRGGRMRWTREHPPGKGECAGRTTGRP